MGKRLQKSADALANARSSSSCERGRRFGWRIRHGIDIGDPERNFEMVAGKVLDEHGACDAVRLCAPGRSRAASAAGLALRRHGITEDTSLTVLTDGDAGLRAIHRQVAPHAEHVLDWFHVSDAIYRI